MKIITDDTQIRLGVELDIDLVNKRIKLHRVGNLKRGRVDWRIIYVKLKEIWRTGKPYIVEMFPIMAIDEHEFEFNGGWDFADDETRDLIALGNWWVKKDGQNYKRYETVEVRKIVKDKRTGKIIKLK